MVSWDELQHMFFKVYTYFCENMNRNARLNGSLCDKSHWLLYKIDGITCFTLAGHMTERNTKTNTQIQEDTNRQKNI